MPTSSERLPSLDRVTRLVLRSQHATKQAREYNEKLSPDGQEQLYLAGMSAIAKRFWDLACDEKSDPHEVKIYFDMMKDHFELKIKTKKNDLASRHLKLLEAKSKALAELAKDTSLSDMQVAGRIREIFGHEKTVTNGNGHQNGQPKRLIENGLAS